MKTSGAWILHMTPFSKMAAILHNKSEDFGTFGGGHFKNRPYWTFPPYRSPVNMMILIHFSSSPWTKWYQPWRVLWERGRTASDGRHEHHVKHTLFSLSDHYILSQEWRVIVNLVQTNSHGRSMLLKSVRCDRAVDYEGSSLWSDVF